MKTKDTQNLQFQVQSKIDFPLLYRQGISSILSTSVYIDIVPKNCINVFILWQYDVTKKLPFLQPLSFHGVLSPYQSLALFHFSLFFSFSFPWYISVLV